VLAASGLPGDLFSTEIEAEVHENSELNAAQERSVEFERWTFDRDSPLVRSVWAQTIASCRPTAPLATSATEPPNAIRDFIAPGSRIVAVTFSADNHFRKT